MIKAGINYMELSIEDKSSLCRLQEAELIKIFDCYNYKNALIVLAVSINLGLINVREINLDKVNKSVYKKSIIKIGRVDPKELIVSLVLYAYRSKREHKDSCQKYFVIPYPSYNYKLKEIDSKAYIFELTNKGEEVFKKECLPAYFNVCFMKKRKSEIREEINMIIDMIGCPLDKITSMYDFNKKTQSFKLD